MDVFTSSRASMPGLLVRLYYPWCLRHIFDILGFWVDPSLVVSSATSGDPSKWVSWLPAPAYAQVLFHPGWIGYCWRSVKGTDDFLSMIGSCWLIDTGLPEVQVFFPISSPTLPWPHFHLADRWPPSSNPSFPFNRWSSGACHTECSTPLLLQTDPNPSLTRAGSLPHLLLLACCRPRLPWPSCGCPRTCWWQCLCEVSSMIIYSKLLRNASIFSLLICFEPGRGGKVARCGGRSRNWASL